MRDRRGIVYPCGLRDRRENDAIRQFEGGDVRRGLVRCEEKGQERKLLEPLEVDPAFGRDRTRAHKRERAKGGSAALRITQRSEPFRNHVQFFIDVRVEHHPPLLLNDAAVRLRCAERETPRSICKRLPQRVASADPAD